MWNSRWKGGGLMSKAPEQSEKNQHPGDKTKGFMKVKIPTTVGLTFDGSHIPTYTDQPCQKNRYHPVKQSGNNVVTPVFIALHETPFSKDF